MRGSGEVVESEQGLANVRAGRRKASGGSSSGQAAMLAFSPLGGLAVLGIDREHDGAACSQVGEQQGVE